MSDLVIGLMSGTSADGVSAALVRFHGARVRVLAHRTLPYPAALRRRLAQGPALRAAEISALHMHLGAWFARAALRVARAARVSPARVRVIGSAGHTLYHGPRDAVPSTLQIGAAAVIARRTGCPIVADFRVTDVAAGGDGAPLVPAFDAAFFGHGPPRALQNLGGIANVTVVGRGVTPLAFDTGPGNCLIDLVAARIDPRLRYDRGGTLARRGRIDQAAIARLWRLPFFRRPPPKSTGRELFDASLLRAVFGRRLARTPLDALATVTFFTAFSIAESYRCWVPHRLREVVVSGGGTRNRTLMRHLAHLLHPVPVRPIDRYGIPTQAKEPAAFAYLALRTLQGRAHHLPRTTGARLPCLLGAITPGGRHVLD